MTIKSFKKSHPMFFYATIILAVIIILMATYVVVPAKCRMVQLEEAVPYTEQESYITTEEVDVPLKYGAYHYVFPTYYNWTYYTVVKVYVTNIDERTGYFTVHVDIMNETDTTYDNLTYPIEEDEEVLYYFEYEEGQVNQNITAEYTVDPGTYKKTMTYTKYRNITKYRTQKVNKTVCV